MRRVNVALLFGGTAIESGTVNVTPGCVTAGSYATRYVLIVPEPLFSTTQLFDAVNVPRMSGAPNEAPTTPGASPLTDTKPFERAALATSMRPAPMRLTASRLP